ncbi:MAG: hypothetical protein IIB03_06275, partial [Acidobacteria bacterium]|nr:hypothetical protein [Acidobacteriota bacterium]
MKRPLPALLLGLALVASSPSHAQKPSPDEEALDWVESTFEEVSLEE